MVKDLEKFWTQNTYSYFVKYLIKKIDFFDSIDVPGCCKNLNRTIARSPVRKTCLSIPIILAVCRTHPQ